MVDADYIRRALQVWHSERYADGEHAPFSRVRNWQALLRRASDCEKTLRAMERRGIDFEPVSIAVSVLFDIRAGGRRYRIFPEAKAALRATTKRIAEHLNEVWLEENRARARERAG